MIRSTALGFALALLASSAVACGGAADAGEADVKEAAHAFFRDVSTNAGDRVCSRLMERARRQFVDGITLGPDADCELAVTLYSDTFSAEQREAIREVRVRDVEVDGDRAVIHDDDVDVPDALGADRNDRPMVLRHVRGRWLIEDVG